MEWYLPITILPAIGLLIMSTTNQMLSVSGEIAQLLEDKCTPMQHQVSDMKIKQLGRLTKSVTLLYITSALFVLSGLISAVLKEGMLGIISQYILVAGVILFLGALCFLIFYGFQTIKIRSLQHEHNHDL